MLVVEPVRNADLEPVAKLALRSLQERYDAHWLAEHAQVGKGSFMVARDVPTNEVVGFALASREEGCDGHLLALAVDSHRRGQGIGAALLSNVRQDLARTGAMRLSLEVRMDDPGARAYYARHGFEPVGLEQGVYSDGGDALRMERPV